MNFKLNFINRAALLTVLSTLGAQLPTAHAQGTAFTYQGRLNDSGAPANGSYDLRFAIFDASSAGNQAGNAQTNTAAGVTNGIFSVTLDFGGIFTGTNYWLDVRVRTNGTGAFAGLTPRQPLLPVPYAIFANTAGNLSGTIANSALPSSPIFSGTVTGSSFSGSGANLTSIDAGNISSGILADARLSDNVALRAGGNMFTEPQFFNGPIYLNSTAGFDQSSAGNFLIDAPFVVGGRFAVLTNGNVGIGTSNPSHTLDVNGDAMFASNNFFGAQTRQMLNLWGTQYGVGVQSYRLYFRTDSSFPGGGFAWFQGGTHSDATDDPGTNGAELMRLTGSGLTINGTVSGNGALPWQIVSGTSQLAQPKTGYLLTNNSLVAVTLPVSPSIGDVVRVSGIGAGGWKIAQNAGQFVRTGNLPGNIGSTWTPRDSNRNWYSVASSSDGTKLVAGIVGGIIGGQIYTSTNSGTTWTARDSNRNWYSVASSSDGTKLVAGVDGGQIYTSTDSGVTWTPHDSSRNWRCVASSSDGTRLVAGVDGGQIYTSADSGGTWTPQNSAFLGWYSVASSSDGVKLVAAAFGGQIYTSTDSGVTWTPRDSNRAWYSVASSSNGAKLVAGVQGGQIYTSTDSGVTWTPRDNNRQWYSLASSADGTKLVAGVSGDQIYNSTDSGVTWTAQNSGGRSWYSVASSSDGTKVVAAAYGDQIYTAVLFVGPSTTPGTAGYLLGNQNAAIELQYVGNGQFLPISSVGTFQAF